MHPRLEALTAALADADPLVQGRAAEALGLIAHKPAADPIAAMMAVHTKAGVLSGIAPDDLEYPKAPAVEAVRLGMYALVRLSAYDALASVLTDGSGRPVSQWWPVAFAFRRIGDARAGPVLLALLQSPGAMTRAFAARGLGVVKEQRAVAPLVAVLGSDAEVHGVRIEAARALADLGAPEAVDALTKVIKTPKADPNVRLEAVTALGQLQAGGSADLFVDLLTDTWPSLRSAAFTALARADAEMFLTVLSGIEPDAHWSVRAALASALGGLDVERARPRLTLMLQDPDQRVIPAVLGALVASGAPEAESVLLERIDGGRPRRPHGGRQRPRALEIRPRRRCPGAGLRAGRQRSDVRCACGRSRRARRARRRRRAAAPRARV